jgi:hypothetical protein
MRLFRRIRRGGPEYLRALALAALCTTMVACQKLGDPGDPGREVTADGLLEVQHRTSYLEFARPDADLSAYDKIMIQPVRVAYTSGGETEAIAAKDYDRLDRQFRSAVVEVVGRTYPIVEEAGAGVLLLETSILDLSLEHQGSMRATIFVTNQDVTMVAELRDSESLELLYRAEKRQRIADSPMLLMDAIEFWSNLERFLETWAISLVEILDHATTRHSTDVSTAASRPIPALGGNPPGPDARHGAGVLPGQEPG